jgi:hypothetical protein
LPRLTLAASPEASGKPLSAFVDPALSLNEDGKRFDVGLVLHRVSQYARPLGSRSLVDLCQIGRAANDRGKRLVVIGRLKTT